MSYNAYDSASPVGTQTGPVVCAKVKSNENALRDLILIGGADTFDYSTSGGSQPATIYFQNGVGGSAVWIKGVVTWVAGIITQVDWSKSVNGGSSYDPIGSLVPSYDTDGNLESTSGGCAGMGLVACLLQLQGSLVPACTMTLSAPQLMTLTQKYAPAAYNLDDVLFDEAFVDALGMFNPTTHAIDIALAGTYHIDAGAQLAAVLLDDDSTQGFGAWQLYVVSSINGVVLNPTVRYPNGSAGNYAAELRGSVTIACAAGESLSMQIRHQGKQTGYGGTNSILHGIDTYLSAHYVGKA